MITSTGAHFRAVCLEEAHECWCLAVAMKDALILNYMTVAPLSLNPSPTRGEGRSSK